MIKLFLGCLILVYLPVSVAGDSPRLALANRYHDNIDISRYLISEKLDGVRAYWDGKHLYTRNGNKINAPEGFTKGWPAVKLDGELWIARGLFERVSGIVRRRHPALEDWKPIRFMVFDLHDSVLAFTDRLERMKVLIDSAGSVHLELIEQVEVNSKAALAVYLERVVAEGGEGLMLHRKVAPYSVGRSSDVLKLKPLWDAEARVIRHVPGRGRNAGLMGSLEVEGVSEAVSRGKRFRIGTGFTDRQRKNPPPIGSIVTYQYQGHTSKGLPRFARFLKLRNVEVPDL